MKKIFVSVVMLLAVHCCMAQTYAEWFRQKKTQQKYLLENIAALKLYAGYVQKGYGIVRDGLNTIKGWKDGDFKLHSDKFAALGMVSPKVKGYVRVAETIAMQVSIMQAVSKSMQRCRDGQAFTADDLAYLQSVYGRLLDDCAKALDELSDVVSNGRQQMTDDERIKRIDQLYAAMKDRQVFVQSFANGATGLAVQRKREQVDVIISKKLNGLP